MKKIVFLIAIAFTLGFNVQAQKKLGYVNSQELISIMPEAKQADSILKKYIDDLQTQMQTMAEDGQKRFQEYQQNASTWSEPVIEAKEKELQDIERRIQEFRSSADEKIRNKEAEVFNPLLEKAQKAISEVGKEGGFDYIFDGSSLLYAKDSEDILPQVKAKLGIK